MKGILLAGGSGSRLYPSTIATSKQLLNIYDKPMIYYPLSIMMMFGVKDILIISTPYDIPNIEKLLGDGKNLGINLQYKIQNEPKGIAQALLIGEEFIDGSEICLMLGDNIFHLGGKIKDIKQHIDKNLSNSQATVFSYHVNDPENYGVLEFDKNQKIKSIEEKPLHPKSHYVSVGLYFYPKDAVSKAKTLEFSDRGELEITDLHKLYLQEERLSAYLLGRGNAWLDAGTPDNLLEASQFVQIIEKRQGRKIACLEEIALHMNYITPQQFETSMSNLKNCDYKKYLKTVYDEYLYENN
jgi:glucose-1-phosphate thymidylyltransferase